MNKNRKIIILLGDGMGDYPLESLGGMTPLQAAYTPNMDYIAKNGMLGITRTVPEGMSPGSDTANLSVFGYNPKKYYTGRAPLEALNMGIELGPEDAAFRCNMVTLEGDILTDFSADHIESGFSKVIMNEMKPHFAADGIEFYAGVSYRNIMVWRGFPYEKMPDTTPPHDIQGKKYDTFLPSGNGEELLRKIMEKSITIIRESSEIKAVSSVFKGKPVSLWLWGPGRKPSMQSLEERFGLTGHTIAAVDLIHGIGKAVGLTPLWVDGATGYIDTNYCGKAEALLRVLNNVNYVFLHVEAPDESGHEGDVEKKIKSIQDFDEKVVGTVLQGLKGYSDYSLLVMPDHYTPVSLRTHSTDYVPFEILRCRNGEIVSSRHGSSGGFNEKASGLTGCVVEHAHDIINILVED
ncbi:MAG TPA: cofactor-independent phosphoglycerate mutase [Spirochaetota bacterium]|nr:cofactor-independent phosphoglycerate mutase [Spirochaetota bacterium]HQO03341.1 cofactor-independent phosphoglycerate mutase [Spirochaetota bacterium]HQP47380.1 cofactor-independent phosphoglycerate mutase [Spirochaetota bacterium]